MPMSFDDYLFRGRSWYAMRDMVRRMKVFRFLRAPGGHLEDYDKLVAALRFDDEADMRRLMAELGAPEGASTKMWEYIPDVDMSGVEVGVQINPGKLLLTVWGVVEPWEVTEADVAAAVRVEAHLERWAHRFVDPPLETNLCVSPALYPDLFADDD